MNIVLAPKSLLSDPESIAMIQAFYSRSKRGIDSRLEETTLDTDKIKEKLSQYFVGYGHDSIGQCGFTVFFIEDVSLLLAKVIEDNDLFNGQESSTRYIDYANEERINPNDSNTGAELQQMWINIYDKARHGVEAALIERNRQEGDDIDPGSLLAKACRVKAFDIARCFLPAGVTTNVSWVTSLSGINRELARLFAHPLLEVQALAHQINAKVKENYPSIYKDFENDPAMLEMVEEYKQEAYHYTPRGRVASMLQDPECGADIQVFQIGTFDSSDVTPRMKYARMPRHMHQAYLISSRSDLDFASYRDAQRHRTLHPGMPLLSLDELYDERMDTDDLVDVFGSWYIKALIDLGVFDSIKDDIIEALNLCLLLGSRLSEPTMQYYLPIGLRVEFPQAGFIGDWITTLELRSGETVHPTVRLWAADVWATIKDQLNTTSAGRAFLKYAQANVKDVDPSTLLNVSIRRASQDIVQK